MKRTVLFCTLLLVAGLAQGQTAASGRTGNQSFLSRDDRRLVDEKLRSDTFDFSNKQVGFAGISTFGNIVYQLRGARKNPRVRNQDLSYRLLVLDSSERQATRGFDAIVLCYRPEEDHIVKRMVRTDILDAMYNDFSEDTAATDARTESNLRFVNALLSRKAHKPVDIRKKKFAIVRTIYGKAWRMEQMSLAEYRRYAENELSQWDGINVLPHWLTTAQRKASGGYDLLIHVGENKKGTPVEQLIAVVRGNK